MKNINTLTRNTTPLDKWIKTFQKIITSFDLDELKLWKMRIKQRRDLSRLSPSRLNDLGISEVERKTESEKPFWKA